MSKNPSFLFYPSDFLIGCADLTWAERGQYITLLCLQYEKGHLNKRIIDITIGTKVDPDTKEEVSLVSEYVLEKFAIDDNGCYYNKRLEEELDKRQKFVESRKNNLTKNNTEKIHKETHMNSHMEHHMESHMDNHMSDHMENENVNINVIINSLFNYWNSKQIIVHRELNKDIKDAIKNALNKYTEEQIKECIDRYATILSDPNYFWGYKWTLKGFLSRREGISSFTDEGDKWCSYQASLKRPNQKSPFIESTFDVEDFYQASLERSEKYYKAKGL